MSDAYVVLQVPNGPIRPVWYTPYNSLWDHVREDFGRGGFAWDGVGRFGARLYDTNFVPDFEVEAFLNQIPGSVWIGEPVTLQDVICELGFLRCLGVRFPSVDTTRQLGGCAIYEYATGRMVWAASDFIGNLPVVNQDVYVVWPGNYGGPARI